MKNFIEELFYGNIDPQARVFKKDSYLQKQMTILADSEEVLNRTLTGEDKEALKQLVIMQGLRMRNEKKSG